MKRYGYLFDSICSIENLKLADTFARKGKKCKREIERFDLHRDRLLDDLHTSLKNKTFVNSPYRVFKKIVDSGKEREIYRLPYYPDRILHHAIMNVIEPVFHKIYITDTYSCIKGRGIHKAADRVKGMMRIPENNYVLKLDIKKFYPSVNHESLKVMLRMVFKDRDLLWLLDVIIDSAPGLPIGNYTSQSFANLYLSGLDHWIKENRGEKYYVRYCDDMVIFGDSKGGLHQLRKDIDEYLRSIHLTIKGNWRIFPLSCGVDFLGFVFYPTHTLLRKSIKKRFIISYKRFIKQPTDSRFLSLASSWGWLKYCDTRHLVKTLCAK